MGINCTLNMNLLHLGWKNRDVTVELVEVILHAVHPLFFQLLKLTAGLVIIKHPNKD